MRTALLIFALALLGGFSLACNPPQECQGSNVSYTKCIRPTLTANCSGGGCHGGDKPEWGLQLETIGKIYDSILPHINTANPAQSKLLVQMKPDPPAGRRMPIDLRPFLSDSQLQMFETWIKEGAINDDPNYKGGDVTPEKPEIPADVTNVSYTTTIVPLLLKGCGINGCHSTSTKSGALDLEANVYDNIVNIKSINQAYDLVAPGKPLESLMLLKLLKKRPLKAGSEMPPGGGFGVKETAQVYVWIEEGAKKD